MELSATKAAARQPPRLEMITTLWRWQRDTAETARRNARTEIRYPLRARYNMLFITAETQALAYESVVPDIELLKTCQSR